jgi:biotin carboxyl carrier protein
MKKVRINLALSLALPYFPPRLMEGGMIIRAEWPGYVVDVLVAPGQEVEEDETLMLLEGTDATHTPFYVSAPESGKVKHILLEEGDFAEEDDDLVELAEMD